MDLTTLTLVFMMSIAALGLDAVWHPKDVLLEGSSAGQLDKATVDKDMINVILQHEVERISSTPSLIAKPSISLSQQEGIGMALATAANLQSVAFALQTKVGLGMDQIKISLFSEDGLAKVLVTGSGRHRVGTFEQLVVQQKGETVIDLLHRAALVGMARIDPYLTALNLMQRHSGDKDFADTESLITFAKSQLPPTPTSPDRSLFENLQGVMALFRGNRQDAHTWFDLAVRSNPANVVAILNEGFTDLTVGQYETAAERMSKLIETQRPSDPILVSTAYVTWGAARMGMHDVNGADELLNKAISVDPTSAVAWEMWSQVKSEKGDPEVAAEMHRRALEASANFENYAEVATLYFQLTWKDHQPVTRSLFANPATTSQH